MGSDFFSYWKGQRAIYRAYWATYGGAIALIKSPYFHLALVIAGA